MRNPLSLEERTALFGLIDHDSVRPLDRIALIADTTRNPEQISVLYRHARYFLMSMMTMGANKTRVIHPISAADLRDVGRLLVAYQQEVAGVKLEFSCSVKGEFPGNASIFYTALHNLVKNSVRAVPEGRVSVSIADFGGLAPDIVYLPYETSPAGSFVKFEVRDNGPGFPADRPLSDFLKKDVSTKSDGKGGFGLYYVALASKFLGAPLSIHSEPGNTSVAFYHPKTLIE